MFDNAKHMQFFAEGNSDRLIALIRRFEPHAIRPAPETLYRVFAIDGHDDDAAIYRFRCPVY